MFVPTGLDGSDGRDGEFRVADDDGYHSFGWWSHDNGADKEDAERFNFDVFALAHGMSKRGSGDREMAGAGNILDGTATYRGGAAGKYAVARTDIDHHHGGHFTAQATFTANFDADSDGVDFNGNDKNGISLDGKIFNFMTGDMPRPSWSITLTHDSDSAAPGVQTPTTLGDIEMGAGSKAVWKTGGALNGTGTWRASYYGPTKGKTTDFPTDIVGEFNAAVSEDIARIIGAFGATLGVEIRRRTMVANPHASSVR